MTTTPHDLPSRAGRGFAVGAAASVMLLLPFVALEQFVGGGFRGGFPTALFVTLWLLTLACILVARPIVRALRARDGGVQGLVRLWPAVVALAVFASLWISIVADQMPCFLGVPNCD